MTKDNELTLLVIATLACAWGAIQNWEGLGAWWPWMRKRWQRWRGRKTAGGRE